MFFILVASLVFFYFTARTLKLRSNYEAEIKLYQDQLALVETGKQEGRESAQGDRPTAR